MLTLTGQRDIADCNVYRDDSDPLTYYYLSSRPRIAVDDSGRPIFSLVMYRRNLDGLTDAELRTKLGGGLLTLSVELTPTDAELTQIRQTLAADPAVQDSVANALRGLGRTGAIGAGEVADALRLTQMPLQDGSVILAVGGETGTDNDEFVARLIGAGPASIVGSHRAAFTVKLTLEGAALVEETLERDLATLFVGYTLNYHHRLEAVKMIVHADASRVYHATQELIQSLQDNASFSDKTKKRTRTLRFSHDENIDARDLLDDALEVDGSSYVRIIPEGPISAELMAELERQGHEMLLNFMASSFLDFDPSAEFNPLEQPTLETELPEHKGRAYGHHGIEFYQLKEWDRSMEATLDHVFTSQQVIESTLSIGDNVSHVLGGRNVSEFIAHVDLESDFHKFLDVRVLCTANFVDEPVDLVELHIEYDQTGPNGRIRQVKDLAFRKDSGPGQFRTFLAKPELDRYRYRGTVHYSGTQQAFEFSGETNQRLLVLDVDTLGILDVTIAPGIVDWDMVSQIKVRMSYGTGSTALEQDFVLNSRADTAKWTEVIGEAIAGPYTYRTVFVDKSGQHIESAPTKSTAKRLLVDQPMEHTMRVDVVPAGQFGGESGRLRQVKVALRYQDPANDHLVENIATLAKSTDSFQWMVPLINKELRTYQYQATVIYVDGVVREDEWRTSDKATLPVGDPFTYSVAINPMLLNIPPGRFSLGKIHVVYADEAHGTFSEKTFQISNFAEVIHWHFRLGSLERKSYRYQLTLWGMDASGNLQEIALPEATHDQEVLILKPPPITP